MNDGLGVADVIDGWPDAAPDGAFAEWRFTAPLGTSIRALAVTRDIGNRDEWTPYGRIDAVDQAGESCMRGMNQSFCRIEGRRVFSGLDASTVAYGVRCVTAPYCAHGATLRTVWALILGATVTLDDLEPPTVTAPDPTGLADGAWHNAPGALTFSASDNTGVRRRRVVEGAVERGSWVAPGAAAGGCGELNAGVAYTHVQPCAGSRGLNGARTVSLDPCGWGDGTHALRSAAVDTGGTERVSATAATVRVDCSAPLVRVTASSVDGRLRADVQADDPAAGVTRTDVELSVDGGRYAPYVANAVAVEAGRTYRVRARATDRAGNASGWTVSDPVMGPTTASTGPGAEQLVTQPPQQLSDPVGETPPIARLAQPPAADPGEGKTTAPARVRIARRTVTARALRVTGTAAHTARVRVEATITVNARRRVLRRTAAVTAGRWTATLRLPRRGRVRIVRVSAR